LLLHENFHLKEGDQFVIIGQGDAVILKAITPPSMDEFEGLLKEARALVKKSNLKKYDVKAAIKRATPSLTSGALRIPFQTTAFESRRC